jgi:septal ring-binding cell division protein DamX
MYLGLMILVGSIVVATVNSNNSENPDSDQENNKQQRTSADLVINDINTEADNARDNSKQIKSDLDPNKKDNKAPIISGSPILEIEQGDFIILPP